MARKIESNAARAEARKYGMFARLSALGTGLVFYTGDERNPGTWLEAGRLDMDDRNCVHWDGLMGILRPVKIVDAPKKWST